MTYQEEFQALLAEYREAAAQVNQKRKFFDGLFGLGNRPGDAPCHEEMDRKTAELCLRAAEDGEADTASLAALTEAVFRAESEWQGPDFARLMLSAVQRHALPLLPKLSPEDRRRLHLWFSKEYPRRRRFPVQEEILEALQR